MGREGRWPRRYIKTRNALREKITNENMFSCLAGRGFRSPSSNTQYQFSIELSAFIREIRGYMYLFRIRNSRPSRIEALAPADDINHPKAPPREERVKPRAFPW